MKMWAIGRIDAVPFAVEVERATDKSVWIKGRRNARHGEWRSYFDTFEEARQALINREEGAVAAAQSRLDRARDRLKKARNCHQERDDA